ncbi:cell division protein FtsQ/DivIB [Spirochaeta dissipatitropha]
MADYIYHQQSSLQNQSQNGGSRRHPGSSGNTGRSGAGGTVFKIIRRLIFILIFAGSAFVVAELLFQLVLAPRLLITSIIIEGDVPMELERVLEIAGISEGNLYFSLDTSRIESLLAAVPRIKQVQVEKDFPSTLRIRMFDRTPTAIAQGRLSGRRLPVVADEDGVLFSWGVPDDYKSLPVISGFEIEDIELGMRLPSQVRRVLRDLESLRMRHPVLYNLISEVLVKPVHEHKLDLIVYFTHVPVPVLVGEDLKADRLMSIIRIMDVLAVQGQLDDVTEIDFRGNDVVYTRKEG